MSKEQLLQACEKGKMLHVQHIEQTLERVYQDDLFFDEDTNKAFEGQVEKGSENNNDDFTNNTMGFCFDTYTSKVVVSSYKHLYSQLLDQQKLLSSQMSSLVKSYINSMPVLNKSFSAPAPLAVPTPISATEPPK